MDQRGDRIGLALIGVAAACLWVWAAARCRTSITRPAALPLLTLVALAGVYLCVPETDQLKGVALLVVGVALVELASSEALPFAWHAMVMVTVLWAGLWGAQTRPSAVVGAVFSGWIFVMPAITPPTARPSANPARSLRYLIAAVAVLFAARTGGLALSAARALGSVAAVGVASLISAELWLRVDRRRHQTPK